MTPPFSSGSPGVCDGSITVVRASGDSIVKCPWPYAKFIFMLFEKRESCAGYLPQKHRQAKTNSERPVLCERAPVA